MGMSSTGVVALPARRHRARRVRPRSSTPRSCGACWPATREQLPLIDGAVEASRRLADGVPARARIVVQPAADRRCTRERGPGRAVRGDRLVRGGRNAASLHRTSSSRLRDDSVSSPRGAPRSRTRRTGSARRTPPECASSRSRTVTTRRSADALALADVGARLARGPDARGGDWQSS